MKQQHQKPEMTLIPRKDKTFKYIGGKKDEGHERH